MTTLSHWAILPALATILGTLGFAEKLAKILGTEIFGTNGEAFVAVKFWGEFGASVKLAAKRLQKARSRAKRGLRSHLMR